MRAARTTSKTYRPTGVRATNSDEWQVRERSHVSREGTHVQLIVRSRAHNLGIREDGSSDWRERRGRLKDDNVVTDGQEARAKQEADLFEVGVSQGGWPEMRSRYGRSVVLGAL